MEITLLTHQENLQRVNELLDQHQEQQIGIVSKEPEEFSLAAFEQEQYLGGIIFRLLHESAHISFLATAPDARTQGIGTRLIEAAEARLRERGCEIITVNTQDFQAADFYQKLGYVKFAALEDYPFKGTTKIFFKKYL